MSGTAAPLALTAKEIAERQREKGKNLNENASNNREAHDEVGKPDMSGATVYGLALSAIEQIRASVKPHSIRVKKSELTLKQISSVRCPTCGVPARTRCVLHSGAPRSESHVDRKFAAIKASERK